MSESKEKPYSDTPSRDQTEKTAENTERSTEDMDDSFFADQEQDVPEISETTAYDSSEKSADSAQPSKGFLNRFKSGFQSVVSALKQPDDVEPDDEYDTDETDETEDVLSLTSVFARSKHTAFGDEAMQDQTIYSADSPAKPQPTTETPVSQFASSDGRIVSEQSKNRYKSAPGPKSMPPKTPFPVISQQSDEQKNHKTVLSGVTHTASSDVQPSEKQNSFRENVYEPEITVQVPTHDTETVEQGAAHESVLDGQAVSTASKPAVQEQSPAPEAVSTEVQPVTEERIANSGVIYQSEKPPQEEKSEEPPINSTKSISASDILSAIHNASPDSSNERIKQTVPGKNAVSGSEASDAGSVPVTKTVPFIMPFEAQSNGVSDKPTQQPVRKVHELPAFDIFSDKSFISKKSTADKKNPASAKDRGGGSVAPERAESEPTVKAVPAAPEPTAKAAPAAPEPTVKAAPAVPGSTAKSAPAVPEPTPKAAHEPVDSEGKNFTEGRYPGLTYHASDLTPFVVMAGKFTESVRGEYNAIRLYKKSLQKPIEQSHAGESKPSGAKAVTQKAASSDKPAASEKNSHAAPGALPKQTDTSKKSELSAPAPRPVIRFPGTQHSVTINPPVKDVSAQSDTAPVSDNTKPKKAAEASKAEPPQKKTDSKKKPVAKKAVSKKSGKTPNVKKNKKPLKARIAFFFGTDEEFDPDDNVAEEISDLLQIDDYSDEEDAATIRSELTASLSSISFRTILLLISAAFSVILAIVSQATPLFRETIHNGWLVYALICFALFTASVVISRRTIVNGLMPLIRFKGNSDTAFAVASLACGVQSITSVFTPDRFIDGTMYIYVPLVTFALFLNSLGKVLIMLRTNSNFRYLTKTGQKHVGKIYTDIQNAEKMVADLPSKKTIIGYTKRTGFVTNFLHLSYTPDPSEELAVRISPYIAVFSLLCGIVYGVITKDIPGAASAWALTACVGAPVVCLLAVNLPMFRLCEQVIRRGAMITCYETVRQFCDTNAVMIDSSQLYPKGSVTFNGMKTFKQTKLDDALSACAAIMYAVNGTLTDVFEDMIHFNRDKLPKVESVIYEDGRGLVGWVKGSRVLIGNRELLAAHNITPPEPALEERHRKNGFDIAYISVSGELIAMLILKYTPRADIVHELRTLEDNGVSFIIRTVDPNITKEAVAEKFYLYHRCVTVLPTGLGNICHEVMSSADESTRAYLVTGGKLSAFARAVSGCIRMRTNVSFTKIIQSIAVFLGLGIFTVICFVSGFEKLGCVEILIYLAFWASAALGVSLIIK